MNPAKRLFLFLVFFLIAHISPAKSTSCIWAGRLITPTFAFAQEPTWSVNIGRNISSRSYSMELDETGNLYIPKEGGLVKVSSSGVKEWEYEIPNKWTRQIMGSPKVVGDAVVLVSGVSGAYAYFINRQTGELIREQELVKIGVEGNPYYYSKPSVSTNGNYLYIHLTAPSIMYGFNTSSYNLIGEYYVGYGPSYAPQVTGLADIMYSGSNQGYAFSAYPYAVIDNFGEGDIDKINFAKDPSSSLTGGLYLLGPALNYKDRKLYYFDRLGPSKAPALLVLNLGDGTLLKETTLSPQSPISPLSLNTYSPPILDIKGNVFLLTYSTTGATTNTLFKFNSAGEQVASYTFGVNLETLSTPVVDNQGSVYVQLDQLYKLNSQLDQVLFSFDLTSYGNSGDVGSALTLSDDQTSIYLTSRDGTVLKLATNYQDVGCIRDYYCDSSPKHHPTIFVHGLGGKDTDWLSGNKAGMRDLILEEYRKDDPEFPEAWAYAYHYGYDNHGVYNYQGDIRTIAKGMQEDVARLSKESLDAGGDGQVDLVGFSLGGQIIREYLAEMVRNMATEEDDRPHHIANAIIIASPNKGSSYLEIKKAAGSIPNSIISIVGDAVLLATNDNNQPIVVNSIAMEQIHAESDFMKRVENRYATDLNYYTLYGDINVTQKLDLFGVSLGGKLSVGDGLVETDSGKNIPGITPKEQIPFGDQLTVEAKIKIKDTYAGIEISQPNILTADRFIHKAFIEQPEVSQKVLEILL